MTFLILCQDIVDGREEKETQNQGNGEAPSRKAEKPGCEAKRPNHEGKGKAGIQTRRQARSAQSKTCGASAKEGDAACGRCKAGTEG
jgi:hypothetical protein